MAEACSALGINPGARASLAAAAVYARTTNQRARLCIRTKLLLLLLLLLPCVPDEFWNAGLLEASRAVGTSLHLRQNKARTIGAGAMKCLQRATLVCRWQLEIFPGVVLLAVVGGVVVAEKLGRVFVRGNGNIRLMLL